MSRIRVIAKRILRRIEPLQIAIRPPEMMRHLMDHRFADLGSQSFRVFELLFVRALEDPELVRIVLEIDAIGRNFHWFEQAEQGVAGLDVLFGEAGP